MGARLPSAVGAGVAAAFLFLFRDPLLGGRIPGDALGFHDVSFVGTVLEQAGAQVRDGTTPLWFPEFDCGTPLAAAWMYGLLYPGLLLFAALPLGAAWAVTVALHAGWGAAGLAAFLRKRGCDPAGAVGGAILFACSEFVVGRAVGGHLNVLLPVVWAPWVLRWAHGCVRGERIAAPLLGLCAGAGLLAGHVQVWFYLAPFLVVVAAADALGPDAAPGVWRRLAAGAGLALGVAAAQIAITAEFLSVAAPAAADPSIVRDTSAPPGLLLSKLLAAFTGDPPADGLDPRAESRGIAGLWAFGLAAWGVVRGAPGRWVWAGAAVFALVAATGLRTDAAAWIQDVPPFSFGRAPARFLVVVVVAVPVLAGHGISALPLRDAGRAAVVAGAAALALAFGTPAVAATTDAVHRWPVAERLPEAVRGHRIHAPVLCQWTNLERQGLETLRTPCFVMSRGYAELVGSGTREALWWLDVAALVDADLEWGPAGPTAVARIAVAPVEAMGRARFFAEARESPGAAETLARLVRGERALWVEGAAPPRAEGPATGSARVVAWTPRSIRIDVETTGPGWLLVSTKLHPGWTAGVDGAPADLRRANLAFPAVRIDGPGRHGVTLAYEPTVFRLGAAVSLLTVAAALVLVVRARRSG